MLAQGNDKRKFIMKKFIILVLVTCAVIVNGCDDEETSSPQTISFAETDFTATEVDGDVTLGFKLDKPANQDVSVMLTLGGTASEGADYSIGESVVIPKGETNGSFTITMNDDCLAESSETIVVSFGEVTGVEGEGSYTVTIPENTNFWQSHFLGAFDCDEPGYLIYDNHFDADPTDSKSIISDNFWDSGGHVRFTFNPATSTVTIPQQTVTMGGIAYVVYSDPGKPAGTYDPCTYSMVVPYIVKRQSTGAILDKNIHTFTKQ
jgi:hypothetical protein